MRIGSALFSSLAFQEDWTPVPMKGIQDEIKTQETLEHLGYSRWHYKNLFCISVTVNPCLFPIYCTQVRSGLHNTHKKSGKQWNCHAFFERFKRNYVYLHPCETFMETGDIIPAWDCDRNTRVPHNTPGMVSPPRFHGKLKHTEKSKQEASG